MKQVDICKYIITLKNLDKCYISICYTIHMPYTYNVLIHIKNIDTILYIYLHIPTYIKNLDTILYACILYMKPYYIEKIDECL